MARVFRWRRFLLFTTLVVCGELVLLVVVLTSRWLRAAPPWYSVAVATGVGCLVPLLIIAIFTTHRYWLAGRPPIGHCQECGYNLTGNVSGICPECGTDA